MSNITTEILLAEDNPGDVFLVREALLAHGLTVNLHVVRDGESAIRFIEAAEQDCGSPGPELALLDLNLPRKSGLEVLARLRSSGRFGTIPVAMFSSCRSPDDLSVLATGLPQETGLRADHFFTKPSDYDQFMALGGVIKHLLESPPGR